MSVKLENFKKEAIKTDISEMDTGNTVRVTENINGKKQSFEGVLIAKKNGKGIPGTITVRKVIDKVGVEKIFPIHSPKIESIEVVKKGRVRKSKAYFLREKTKKVTRKKIKN